MEEIRGSTFKDGVVDVDGKVYLDCIFENMRIQYSGGKMPIFFGCTFRACSFGLVGAASNTVNYLREIYHGFEDWGKGSVEGLFESIRQGEVGGIPK